MVIDKQEFFLKKIASNLKKKSLAEKAVALNSFHPKAKGHILIAMGNETRGKAG